MNHIRCCISATTFCFWLSVCGTIHAIIPLKNIALRYFGMSFMAGSCGYLRDLNICRSPLIAFIGNLDLGLLCELSAVTLGDCFLGTAQHKETDGTLLSTYPRAIAYIRDELTLAGYNPSSVRIEHNSTESASFTIPKRVLTLSLDAFESGDDARKMLFKASLQHEIGHMSSYSLILRALTQILPVTLGVLNGRYGHIIEPRNTALKAAFAATKFFLTVCAVRALEHLDEFQADGNVIKRFEHDSEGKHIFHLRGVIFFVGHLKFQLKPFLKNYPALISRLPSTSPLFWTLKEFFTDDHPTDLARAARFLSASSAPEKPAVTEEALAKIALDIAKKELKEE